MESTEALRQVSPTIEAGRQGETGRAAKSRTEGQHQSGEALRLSPREYPALLRMGQTLQAQGRLAEARRHVDAAREVYPQEAQAARLNASLKLGLRDPGSALQDLESFERLLPGDPSIGFLKGVSLEAMGRRDAAARAFQRFLATTSKGPPLIPI